MTSRRSTRCSSLKTPGTPYDKPQARTTPLTPVQQAFQYGEAILGVRWVLVSDMATLRLYSVDSPNEVMEFDLRNCVANGKPLPEFRELYWFVSHEALIAGGDLSATASLLTKSYSSQLSIRNGFYAAYYDIRNDLAKDRN